MNRRIWMLSLALAALAGSLGWRLRLKYLEAKTHEQAMLGQAPRVRPMPPPPPPPAIPPVTPADYVDVAQKTLFSSDRNPNVAIEVPKPVVPPPPPVMPALPAYYGQMDFGDPVIILTVPKAPEQKSYRVGDKVGDFKLIAFDRDSITFEWNGEKVERKLGDLFSKDPQPVAAAATPAGPALLPGQVTALTGIVAPPPVASTKPPSLGTDMGGGFRACVPGDNSPAGTVVDGYRKVFSQGLMGQGCHWEQAK